jgi:GxxExxY protein
MLVEDKVVVEVKCVEGVHPVHQAQLLSYLRLSGRHVGLLINSYVAHLKDGITRMVDGYGWEKP